MNLRLFLLAGVLALGPGCNQDVHQFLGTYLASGSVTLSAFGTSSTQQRTDTVHVTEGHDTDVVFTSEGGCALPAQVDGKVATVVPNSSCTESVTLPDGTVLEATLVVTSGAGTRSDESITLNYSGTASVTYSGRPLTGTFSSAMTLTRTAAAP